MGLSEFDPAARERVSCNAGRKVGAKRALKPRQIWTVRFFLDQHRRVRDRALFDLAIDSKLCGCDLVKIWTKATVVQQKTGRPVQFELMMLGPASSNGLNCEVAPLRTMPFLAAPTMRPT